MQLVTFFVALVAIASFSQSAFAAPGDWFYHDGTAAGATNGANSWMVYSQARMYVLGGEGSSGYLNSFGYWNLTDPANPNWVLLHSGVANNPESDGDFARSDLFPGGRYLGTTAVDTVSNVSDVRLWLFGGNIAATNYGDLWYYSVQGNVRPIS